MKTLEPRGPVRFGIFEVDLRSGTLRRNGVKVRLPEQSFQVLAKLLERPGAVVSREEIRQQLWPDNTFVDFDNSINAAVNRLREALGDSAANPRFIDTLPRRGYSFIAPVHRSGGEPAAASRAEPPTGELRTGTVLRNATRVRTRAIALAAAATLGLAGVAAILWQSASIPVGPAPAAATHTQVTFSGNVRDVALSPDGRTFAYVTDERDHQRLMVQDLAGGPALELSRGLRLMHPRWSLDGSRLSMSAAGQLVVISRFGGQARVVAEGGYSSWSPDGSRVAVALSSEQGFRILSLAGGETRRVLMSGFQSLNDLDWSRRLDRLAILTKDDRGTSLIWTARPDGAEIQRVYSDQDQLVSPRWSPAGDVIYCLRRRNETMELLGLVLDEAHGVTPRVLLSGLQPGGGFTLSGDGRRLLHTRSSDYSNLWLIDVARHDAAPKPITRGTWRFAQPRVSPDGRWVVAWTGSDKWSRSRIVKLPLSGGDPIPLTFEEESASSPAWSPDGSRIAFASNRGGAPGVWMMDAEGRHQKKLEAPQVSTNLNVTWTPDGRVAWQQLTGQNYLNYRIRDLTSGREEFLAKEGSHGWIFEPKFSPRGDRVAVYWNRPHRERVGLWALSWPDRGEQYLKESASPLGWSPDGHWIYALSVKMPEVGAQDILRISARTGESQIVASMPTGTIDRSGDVMPDGRHVVCSVKEYKSDAWLIENFGSSLRPKAR